MKNFLIVTLLIFLSAILQFYISLPYRRNKLTHTEDIYQSSRSKDLFHGVIYYEDSFNNDEFNIFINENNIIKYNYNYKIFIYFKQFIYSILWCIKYKQLINFKWQNIITHFI